MLLHYHKNLVRQFAWRCKRAGSDVSFGELVLAGDEAMLKAAIKFDSTKGAKFSTFAFLRVQRAIVGYMMENEDVIKIPVHMKELQHAIRKQEPILTQVQMPDVFAPSAMMAVFCCHCCCSILCKSTGKAVICFSCSLSLC